MASRKKNDYKFPEPMENPSLTGHAAAQGAFMDAWGKRAEYPMHPVWILSGARGIGKATLAYRIARFIFRESESAMRGAQDDKTGDLFGMQEEPRPAPRAPRPTLAMDADDHVFQKMIQGGFGDLFIIDMAHNLDKDFRPKTDGKFISVHTIRNMIEKLQLSSMEGGWRVVIIDSVDELSRDAPNALLKILEEPPANTLFLLVAHSLNAVLPTIRSRARVEKLHPLSISELRELCVRFMPDAEISPALLRLANGSFGRIANLKRGGGDELYEKLLELCANPRASSADILALSAQIAASPEIYGIIPDAISHFGLADLYPVATAAIADIGRIYLEPEIAIFKVIMEIRKRVVSA
ncbi:MAG: hypothetical protein FWC61_03560 [Proteobacteria bacterium]|nr:hypothetical protein [Pseudomonadota bacterium]